MWHDWVAVVGGTVLGTRLTVVLRLWLKAHDMVYILRKVLDSDERPTGKLPLQRLPIQSLMYRQVVVKPKFNEILLHRGE